jgi:large conductance mechanosensitive channel
MPARFPAPFTSRLANFHGPRRDRRMGRRIDFSRGPLGERAMSFVSEFTAFIKRGNVIDLAVGVIIGASFGKIVSSLVADIIMPPIGYLVGGVDFSGLSVKLPPLSIKAPDPTNPAQLIDKVLPAAEIKYGLFLQNMFDFLIIAFCVFLLIKAINSMTRKKEAAPPEPPAQEKLLIEIRDLLKARAT